MRSGLALMVLAAAPALAAELKGHVFWEADGSSPRRPLKVELAQDGKVKHRTSTRPDGSFRFSKIPEGRYRISPRIGDIIFGWDEVVVSAAGANFAALMLPKLHAGPVPFATVSLDQLKQWASRASQKHLQAAELLVEAGDLAGAEQRYQEVLQTAPTAEVLDALAVLYARQGRRSEARRMLESAMARDARYLFAYKHLALVLLEEDLHGEAAALAVRALRIDPQWATGHLFLAAARFRMRDFETAARHARAAGEIVQGKWPDPHLLSAKILRSVGECGQARTHLARYLDLRTSARLIEALREPIQIIEDCPATQ